MPNFLPARIVLKFRRPSHREVFEHMKPSITLQQVEKDKMAAQELVR